MLNVQANAGQTGDIGSRALFRWHIVNMDVYPAYSVARKPNLLTAASRFRDRQEGLADVLGWRGPAGFTQVAGDHTH